MSLKENSSTSLAHHAERDVWLTVPNVLTVARMVAIVPFVLWATEGKDLAALILFFIAGLTDTLDGTIARNLGQASKIGRLLDPIADKLFTCIAFVVLSLFRSNLPHIPIWLMTAVLLRDVLILLGSFIVYRRSHSSDFKPSVYGKLNTFLEIGLVVVFLAQTDVPFLATLLPFCYAIVLVSLLVSAGGYLRTGLQMMRNVAHASVSSNRI